MDHQARWENFAKSYLRIPELNLALDISRMDVDAAEPKLEAKLQDAYKAMQELEAGAIANPDEDRMVGHYWLRNASLAPTAELTTAIETSLAKIKSFSADVHSGNVKPPGADKFTNLLVIGIGGSALGPMFVAEALGNTATNKLKFHLIDNTDPEGCDVVLSQLASELGKTLCVVISKSGGTPETRNGMLAAMAAYEAAGLKFGDHAVAITGVDSKLDKFAKELGWIDRFEMWDWVGGRTSETSVVGLLPAALQGIDIETLLAGAKACDDVTRKPVTKENPAALLALCWYHATGGKGEKDMVVLPYKDKLILFSRYLQQLIMESLGKRLDLEGNRVDQGISVYGNKGSTDQHAYVQQLRDGVNNFFAVFIRVLEAGGKDIEVEDGVTMSDYLNGFLLGTREALYENDRKSLTISVDEVNAHSVGTMIALFERAVGFYASLVGINAYHQPGVEAGKQAAASALELQMKLIAALSAESQTTEQLVAKIGEPDAALQAFAILEHLAANGRAKMSAGPSPKETTFGAA